MDTSKETVDQGRRRLLTTATVGIAAASASSLFPSQLAAKGEDIRPFRFEASEEQLAELRRRVAATRWPDKEQVADETQGVRLGTAQKLAQYWQTSHDWRTVEARLNAMPQFITRSTGSTSISFTCVRSMRRRCR